MALDDFINDDDDGKEERPEDLDVNAPGDFDSWVDAEPHPVSPDWHTQVICNKTTLQNENFDKEDTVLITKDVNSTSTYIASDNFTTLDKME